jgi:hypothetical protein
VSLLEEGVLVSRDTIELAVERIALSCCRGPVQVAVVLNLSENGFIEKTYQPAPNFPIAVEARYGGYRLEYSSWMNLRKRMTAAGFRFNRVRTNPDDTSIRWVAYWSGQ